MTKPPNTARESRPQVDGSGSGGFGTETGGLADYFESSVRRLGSVDPNDVQQIAASQLGILIKFHEEALVQSHRSFFWALIGSGAGLALFAVAVVYSMVEGVDLKAVVPLVSGAIVETVSGLLFYLYGKTSSQLSDFHSRLEVLQRYMLANSLCEALGDDERDKTRAALIQAVFKGQLRTEQNS